MEAIFVFNDKMKSEELKEFFKYLCGKKSYSNFTDKISAIVKRIKTSSEWRRDYMHFGVIMQDMIEEQVKILAEERAEEMVQDSYKEGLNEKALETAQRMLEDLMPAETVARYSGLSLEKVEELQKEMEPVKA